MMLRGSEKWEKENQFKKKRKTFSLKRLPYLYCGIFSASFWRPGTEYTVFPYNGALF